MITDISPKTDDDAKAKKPDYIVPSNKILLGVMPHAIFIFGYQNSFAEDKR